MPKLKSILLFTLFLGASIEVLELAAQEPPSEYEVKAAFLYNFAKFIDWPPEAIPQPDTAIIIGVLGEDPFMGALERIIRDKKINGHSFVIKRAKNIQDLKNGHILFISTSEKKRLPDILETVRDASVLTVSELDPFSQQGGIVQFVMEANKVRFKINVKAAERARLRISSRLLNLSK
jgi:hypothetical protein